ncbi:MAG: dTDP-4-dehydrorhamnose 3,5-epimerase family protein [bacterium]|nr:dTDP-4-dehydrorhamnose 3,5-epimerase family protein [bacterium]
MTTWYMGQIEGVRITPLRIIPDDRGFVMHMLRADAPHFKRFGEIYFSGINPGATKGWKVHTRAEGNLAVPHGRVRCVLYDSREESPTYGAFMEVTIGATPDAYRLLTIPAGVALAWRNLSDSMAVVANCATEPHTPDEGKTLSLDTYEYEWDKPVEAPEEEQT